MLMLMMMVMMSIMRVDDDDDFARFQLLIQVWISTKRLITSLHSCPS
jgi:hypothetical protein